MQVQDILDLTDDGDTFVLPDGRTLRLSFGPDDIDPFAEYGDECYGKVEWINTRAYGRPERPSGFDGAARKLWTQSDCYWWQPPSEVVKMGKESTDLLAEQVRDLLAFGMKIIVLELCEGEDHYGRPIVINNASLGGVEPFPEKSYMQSIVSDMLNELELLDSDGNFVTLTDSEV